MLAIAKKLHVTQNISTIKLEHDKFANKRDMSQEIKALYCLLGGYNEVGRHIDIDTFIEFQDQFNQLIKTFKHLL